MISPEVAFAIAGGTAGATLGFCLGVFVVGCGRKPSVRVMTSAALLTYYCCGQAMVMGQQVGLSAVEDLFLKCTHCRSEICVTSANRVEVDA